MLKPDWTMYLILWFPVLFHLIFTAVFEWTSIVPPEITLQVPVNVSGADALNGVDPSPGSMLTTAE